MKICEIEGCNNPVFSKGRCKFHQIRSPIKKKSFIKKKIRINVEKNQQMKDFFLEIWREKSHYSEISGQFLGNVPKTLYFHHLLLKSKHPEAMYDRENIVLLTAEEHSNVHLDESRYELINKKRELLKTKYNIL